MIALIGLVSIGYAQNPRATPFSLSLRAVHTTDQSGSPVSVEITTTNNLSRPLTLSKSNPGMEYQIEVQDAQGQPVAQTAQYKQLQNPEYVFRMTTQVLKPGESAKEIFNIADFFDLS